MKLKQGGRDFPDYIQYSNGFPKRGGKRCPAEGNHTTGVNVSDEESLCLSLWSKTQSLLLSKVARVKILE